MILFPKSGTGVVLCIEKALAQAGVAKEDVNYINAHATSTPSGDLKEFQALVRCFGQNPEVIQNYIIYIIRSSHDSFCYRYLFDISFCS